MHAKLLKRLEKEWRDSSSIEMRLAILKLYAQYCDSEKLSILRRFAEYFDEDLLLDATIPQLQRITACLRYVRRRIAALGPADPGAGRAFSSALSGPDQRRAARTLAHPMVKGLKNRYLAPDSDSDLDDELRGDLLDTD